MSCIEVLCSKPSTASDGGSRHDVGGVDDAGCGGGKSEGEGVGRGRRSAGGGLEGGTLVVCPLSMIGQWRGELESKTRKGSVTVSFHYGTGRTRLVWEAVVCTDSC